MSACEGDVSPDLAEVGRLLSDAGVANSTLRDRVLLREVRRAPSIHSSLRQVNPRLANVTATRLLKSAKGTAFLCGQACVCVSTRAARLSAMATAALLDMSGAPGDSTVAVDGTVFECYPFFKERMEAGLEASLGAERARNVNLVLAKDGSGIGAAIIAALDN